MVLEYRLEATRPTQIGCVVLQADETFERDMRRLMPLEVEVLISRVPSGDEVSPESLAAQAHALTGAAALMPKGAELSALAYCCTSGTAEMGADRVAELLRAGKTAPGLPLDLVAEEAGD